MFKQGSRLRQEKYVKKKLHYNHINFQQDYVPVQESKIIVKFFDKRSGKCLNGHQIVPILKQLKFLCKASISVIKSDSSLESYGRKTPKILPWCCHKIVWKLYKKYSKHSQKLRNDFLIKTEWFRKAVFFAFWKFSSVRSFLVQ